MAYERAIERLFRMDERSWARHANPWSVWTRLTVLPLLTLALWSRAWIGAWAGLPVLTALAWMALNPRLFPEPRRTDGWASKATFGERVWIARAATPIPAHHARAAQVLAGVAALGLLVWIYGVARLDPWSTALGLAVVVLGKLWFCDRMVWLYEDMSRTDPRYAAWAAAPPGKRP